MVTTDTVPTQKKGAKSDTAESRQFSNEKEASAFYEGMKKRLLDITNWGQLCKGASAAFLLTDHSGHPVRRAAREGDHFRIDVPGPGSATGDGFDWVQVETIGEKLTEHGEQLSMRVRPAPNPQQPDDTTAHFFDKSASSTFIVSREHNRVAAEIHGRNELPNMHPHGLLDTVRNALMALAAMLGMSSNQWKKLVKGIIDPPLKLRES